MRFSAYLPSLALQLAKTTLLTVVLASSTWAQTPPQVTAIPVLVVVKVAKPWYAPRSAVVSKMREAVPQYTRIPGLSYKAFSLEQSTGAYGGIYYWQSSASAQAWFNPAWFARVKQERGTDADVRYFEAHVSLDNMPGGTPASMDSTSIVTVVNLKTPPGISRDRLIAEFNATVPTYQKIPGLLRKHFTMTPADSASNSFGGIYLWKDAASAQAWFNEAWKERVRKSYGQDAVIEWFDTPILTPTLDANNAASASTMKTIAP